MHCLSSESLRSLLPNWIQSLWISEGEQNRERLDQTVPTVPSPYTRTEPAVYKLQNSEVAYNVTKPLPVCISNQTERLPRTRTKPLENYISTRPQAISETIVLPDIPPGVKFVKGRITCMGEERPSPEWSTMYLKNKKLAVIMLSNIGQGSSLQQRACVIVVVFD
ncbi:unnamed protein product [Penicillium camemberti]|uniref:Str. FM013 n=1 Tax=Penicillium camemberti (strain FM 013) TaxID=1429867 RepID=A0A0G4PV27_PENC3|nr:unnamed protein product [Penicillium camemberti]